jgi:hypothetical protein
MKVRINLEKLCAYELIVFRDEINKELKGRGIKSNIKGE